MDYLSVFNHHNNYITSLVHIRKLKFTAVKLLTQDQREGIQTQEI